MPEEVKTNTTVTVKPEDVITVARNKSEQNPDGFSWDFHPTLMKSKEKGKPGRMVYSPVKPTAETSDLWFSFLGLENTLAQTYGKTRAASASMTESATKDGVLNKVTFVKYMEAFTARLESIKELEKEKNAKILELVAVTTDTKLTPDQVKEQTQAISQRLAEIMELIESKKRTPSDEDEEEEEEDNSVATPATK